MRMIEEAGFEYAPPPVVPRSLASLELAELARERGAFPEIHVKLFSEHWSKGRDISNIDTLVEIGSSAGLPEEEIRAALSDGRYRKLIEESTGTAGEFGISGIPAWVIDYELLVVGAQPPPVFEQAMERLGHKPAG